MVDCGDWGGLIGGLFKRIIFDFLWFDDFYDLVKLGGFLIDFYVYDVYFIWMFFGMLM